MLRTRGMAPPMLSNEQRKALNRLAKVQGTKFDREWMEAVLAQRPTIRRRDLMRTRRLMDRHVRGCRVRGYERWEQRLTFRLRHKESSSASCRRLQAGSLRYPETEFSLAR